VTTGRSGVAPRIAYIDCFSGVAGDMLLGAIIDAGVPLADLRAELRRLPLDRYDLAAASVTRAGIAATHVTVDVPDALPPRTLRQVSEIISASSLQEADRQQANAVFRCLAEAEAAVHGETVETVHLHDVGAVDAIVDVVGAVLGLRMLGVERVYCSPLPLGEGETGGPHGRLPVPAPATLEIVARGRVPVRGSTGVTGELTTPTGAAIVATLATFERPGMTVERAGYGAGTRDPEGRPNVLRLWLGEGEPAATHTMLLIETNIDDMTGEMLAYVQEKLLAAGAADAWFTPIQMKKSRPAVTLSVICSEPEEETIARLILRETSTLGVRVRPIHRWEADREIVEFDSSLGPAAAKIKRLPGEPPRAAPEFEACKAIAEKTGLSLADVYRIVQAEAEARLTAS
jgi:uncharacterized protein (TIGR00299 family) protein